MHKDISPEERLLSIIKGKQNVSGESAPRLEAKGAEPLTRTPWNKIDDYVLAVLKNDFLKNSILDARVLKIFNKYAVIIAALIAGYLILDLILVSPSRKAAALISKTSLSGPLAAAPSVNRMPIETKGYSYYSNRMSGRNIFGGSSYIQTDSQISGTEQSADLSGANLGLVGIVPGDTPQAIVEEKKNQKTYYLIKGQSINGITVEDIDEEKVVLEYRGKKMTLFL